MPELKTCRTCGVGLDGKVEYELPDGTEYGRCSRCRRPYVVSVGGEVKAPEPESEPEPEPAEPVVEPAEE